MNAIMRYLTINSHPLSFFGRTTNSNFISRIIVRRSSEERNTSSKVLPNVHLSPSFLCVFRVSTRTRNTMVSTRRLIITRRTTAGNVCRFLITSNRRLPFTCHLSTLCLNEQRNNLLFYDCTRHIVLIRPVSYTH